uniref:Protein kinase domain-containing protein n=1 Tax=Brassica campestris TaxID=3711 RepID=M4F8N6_BRACM
MAEIVVSVLAEGVVAFGVEKLWDLLSRESERLQGVHEHVADLERQMRKLQSLLKDADAKKHKNEAVRNFLEDVKDIVYDAEDIIESFVLKESSGGEKGIKRRLKRLSCFLVNRRNVSIGIEGITKRLSEVVAEMQNGNAELWNKRNHGLVGVEESVEELVGHLVKKDNIQVVSISGMGGIGKTTLARQVFHHDIVRRHFDGFAWVCVSKEFQRKDIWQKILKYLITIDEDVKQMDENELQAKLFLLLGTRTPRHLIVLDDVWKKEDWDRVKDAFPQERGELFNLYIHYLSWKMILTSRNGGVGLHADPTCFAFTPTILTPEESWELCEQIALSRRDKTEFIVDKELEAMGKKMVKYCGGLPLAVKVLGGLLANKKYTVEDWKRVYDNIHLRFLSLNVTSGSHLPSSLRNLKLLLYLRLSSSGYVYVPNIFKEMVELRFLFLPFYMKNKTKLELGKLVNLELLGCFRSKSGSIIDLCGMTRLRTLEVVLEGKYTCEILASSLRELRNLEKLSLISLSESDVAPDVDFIWNFIHLRDLVMSMHMPRLPEHSRFPPNLAHISLGECRMEEDPLPILEKLLHLKSVILCFDAFAGRKMVCSKGGFPQLHKLDLVVLKELEEWEIEEGSMSCLRTLSIGFCGKLKEIPEGLKYIISLKELKISDFGPAKLVDDGDFARSSKTIAGSYGYIAPEYGYSLKIGEKSNVYSYGVVVLEVLTGKQPIDPTIQDGLHIVDWVKKMRDIQVIDKGLLARPECDVQEMMQTLGVALLCVNTMPEDRPTMRDVAAMLSEIRQEREESTKGVENNGCSGSCNNNGGERIDDSSPSSVVQQTAKYLRNSSKSFSASSLMYSSFYYY